MTEPSTPVVIAAVDDDESILWALGSLLESEGYEARLFTSANAFLDSDSLPMIGCLISDIDMPSLDGFALVRRAREMRPALPVILLTGYPDTLKRMPPGVSPALRAFTKPFRGPELLAAVAEVLRAAAP